MIEVEVTSPIIEMLNQYGFATVAAIAMGWFIYFIYNYVTGQIIEKLDKAQMTTIALIDRIRMLDNDLIRLVLGVIIVTTIVTVGFLTIIDWFV